MASGMTSSEEFYTAGYSALSHAEASPGFSFRENSEVTEDSETECDLGLGQCTLGVSSEENCMSIEGSKGLLAGDTKIAVDGAKYGSFSKTCQKRASEKSYDGRSGSRTEIAGESIGSCLQEQKNICRKDLENVFIHKLIDEIQQESSKFGDQVMQYISNENTTKGADTRLMKKKFFDAIDEVDRLRSDLTARCCQLESKHRAIQILQVQLEQAYRAHRMEYEACKNLDTNCKKLEKELDEVRWESEVRDYQVEHSQETWTSRLEKLEKENSQLFIALQRTQTQLKCVQRENATVNQEKQELLCLMELTQKNQNQCCESYTDSGSASGGSITKLPFASSTLSLSGLSSTRNDPMDYHLSAVELSVLGACNCGISHAHPCRCAWTLVNSRREIAHLQNRVKDLTQKNEDHMKIIDLYRKAFEDQLEKNNRILKRMVYKQLKPRTQQSSGMYCTPNTSEEADCPPNTDLEGKDRKQSPTRDQMINIVDLLRDKTEEVFHKKLSTQLLADRIYELEKKLAEAEEKVNANVKQK